MLRQSLITGEVPEDWRQANITTIYKKGDRSQAVNYRPVSLTSICCKTMEHIVYRHIIKHLENHQILSDNQHGFRKHRSCETQLVNTIETVARSLDKKEQVDMLILDFSKVFVTMPHQRLINKMEHYGIKGNIHRWVSSWLKMARLTLFYKSINGEAAVNIPPYLTKPTTRTRQYNAERFSRWSTSTDTYKYSFIPRTISDGNNLPPEVILSPSVDSFREGLQKQM